MGDLSLPADNSVSPVSISGPFPLISEDAVDKVRSEVLCDVIMEDYNSTSDITPRTSFTDDDFHVLWDKSILLFEFLICANSLLTKACQICC